MATAMDEVTNTKVSGMDRVTDTTVTVIENGMEIAMTMDIGLVMATGLYISNPISIHNRSSSRHQYTIRHSNPPASAYFFRLIFVIDRCRVIVRILG
jgi:predicted metal-dependent phosphotriesterase family hydrolase